MLNNEEMTNVVLSSEQEKAIEYTKNTLMNLELEVSIATKNLKFLKGETEKVIKDKAYNEELLDQATEKVKILKESEDQLVTTVSDLRSTSSKLTSEISDKKSKKSEIEQEFNDKTKKIDDLISDYTQRSTALAEKESKQHQDSLDLLVKINKLKEFAKTL